MTRKQMSSRVTVARAIIYYDKVHLSKNGKKHKIKVYLLDDDYILVLKNGGTVVAVGYTDLTTTRYAIGRIATQVKEGVYDD